MQISRRDFLRYCALSAAALGLSAADLGLLEKAVAKPGAPTVVWLHGASCTGCSISFLNRVSKAPPSSAADVLISSINLVYHETLMGASGKQAVALVQEAYKKGGYLLVVEGGVPTAFDGHSCHVWSVEDKEVTMKQAVSQFAERAQKIVCVGTCASWGGVAAAAPNPTGVQGVGAVTGKPTINVSGCPPHPDWICWTLGQLLLGAEIALDSHGRPSQLYAQRVHKNCPRRLLEEAGDFGEDENCLRSLGCHGPDCYASCPSTRFNGGANWCIDANAPCIGCTEPTFPGNAPLWQRTAPQEL